MKKLLKNFLSTSTANILGQFIGFITITYYTGVIGKTNFGLVTYAQQIILYFTTFILFGIQTFGIKLIVKRERDINDIVSELFSFRLILSVFSLFICCIISMFLSTEDKLNLILIIWSISLIPTGLNFDWVFAGLGDMKHNAIFSLCKTVIPAALIYGFFQITDNILIIPLFMGVGVLCGSIYHLIILKRYSIKIKYKMNNKIFKMYFIMGLPFLLSGLLSMINGSIGKIVLGANADLGLYQSAYTLVNFIITFIGIVFLPLFPYIVSSYSEGKERIEKVLKLVTKVVLVIVTPMAFGGFLLAKEIILAFFKAEYLEAYIPLQILMIYIFIFAAREVYAYSLNAFGLEKKYLKTVAVSSALSFILNIFFAREYGGIAISVILLVTEVVNFLMMKYYLGDICKIRNLKEILLPIIPSGIMAVFIVFIKGFFSSIFIIIPLAIVVYFIAIVVFRTISIKEVKGVIRE